MDPWGGRAIAAEGGNWGGLKVVSRYQAMTEDVVVGEGEEHGGGEERRDSRVQQQRRMRRGW